MGRFGKAQPTRRDFLQAAAAAAAGLGVGGGGLALISSCGDPGTGPEPPQRGSMPQPLSLGIGGAAVAARLEAGAATDSGRWLFNGVMPGPTLHGRRGELARITLQNNLPESTIVHWHGALVPEHADGHPRFAIGPGASYQYEFPIVQRAATLWYHPHPHHRTAGQVHRGLAGFFTIRDDEEDALRLPTGEREILVMLQDRDLGIPFAYAPTTADHESGMLRGTPFGNGVALPGLAVTGASYRIRVLNASHARVYRLGLSNGMPLSVIGNDGGLLPSPVEVEDAWLGVGERLDLVLDFSGAQLGARAMLKSLPFTVPALAKAGSPQGLELDLLEFQRVAGSAPVTALPPILSSVNPLGSPARERTFTLSSEVAGHRINRLSFEMERIDLQVRMGEVEQWEFINNSVLPHPVHLHGTHFQVTGRTGVRGGVFPYEGGWKDTVLVMPFETVRVLVRFDRYQGIFPLHCHNLQHEDMGMMLNVQV